ncbi:MAG: ParB/RepB/Spo0J family partition protein [Caldilineaceae bacterium]|nr:ParB/RepB/Spo0J family partition protein [Caldilineaceae bacterium]
MAGDTKRRGLGRGLGALIVNTATTPASPEVVAQADAGGLRMVSVEQLAPNPHQPRSNFDETALAELAASIQAHGIIQPLVVTANPTALGAYWLVAGERRWRAAQMAGLQEVPVIVREASPQQLMEWALVENVQRADLNALEEATAYQTLMEEFGLTQADVAERVGKSRSAVANTVRLLNLPLEAQEAIIDGKISAGHARALLALPGADAIRSTLAEILRRELNVRQTESLVRRKLEPAPDPPPPATVDPQVKAHIEDMERRFRSALGTKVSLNRNQDGTGKLIVHFYNDDDLETLYGLIAGEEHG